MPFLTKTGGGGNRRDQDQQQRVPTAGAGWLRAWCWPIGWLPQPGGQLPGWLDRARCPCWARLPTVVAADGVHLPCLALNEAKRTVAWHPIPIGAAIDGPACRRARVFVCGEQC
jgi:hypothetical protein